MAALVIAEHENATLKGSTLNTVAAAAQCDGDVHVLVAGANCGAAAEAAAKIAGVSKVLVADGAQFADGLAENVAEQVLALLRALDWAVDQSVAIISPFKEVVRGLRRPVEREVLALLPPSRRTREEREKALESVKVGTVHTFQGQENIAVGGDLIVAVDGKELTREHDLADEISGHGAGEKVALTVLRDGKRRTITVELGRRPAGSGP